MWSKNVNEVVSTHGYSLNQIIVWRYPSMTKVATLTGHTYRVLYLAMSPDGQTIVTGAGDEVGRNHTRCRLYTDLFPPAPHLYFVCFSRRYLLTSVHITCISVSTRLFGFGTHFQAPKTRTVRG